MQRKHRPKIKNKEKEIVRTFPNFHKEKVSSSVNSTTRERFISKLRIMDKSRNLQGKDN